MGIPLGVPPSVRCQRNKAVSYVVSIIIIVVILVLVLVASIIITTVSLYDPMLETRSRLRWEKCTPAYGAGVIIVKPNRDTVRANEMIAREADLAFDDAGFRRQGANLFQAYQARLPII